ncbi:polyhydroxybutyrate depolymerase [Maritimibacter sp. 55A14]|uniref:alpha/beta hydrolase family esterase n=1 Tax=Maritimibacter sp. 55A14 TaxID=2174844 RepID=UPI000D616ADD|nr:PHB depolymerase family esterase [Maritimibacter sp. 55A14]PWE32911.1 polyhydroxybutyrate depolymerase [Maritimibacter sp. 55A14]
MWRLATLTGYLLLIVALGGPGWADRTCGAPDRACEVAGGAYHVALPANPQGAPVVLWLHGYGRSGHGVLANTAFVAGFTTRGYAVLAPDGQPDIANARNLDWAVNDGHDWPRGDVRFLNAVLTDAVARFRLDGGRVLVAGFSRGGSMVWDFACASPGSAAAFAAVSGGFWEPMHESCAGPVHLLHTHGFGDRLVPVEGREVTFNGLDFVQGNLFKALDLWRRVNGCMVSASENRTTGNIWQKSWENCRSGSVTLWLTAGGHGVPKTWSADALDWFESVVALRAEGNEAAEAE